MVKITTINLTLLCWVPLLKSGGERRLNVAITRSRSGLIVVTSLRSTDLENSSAQSRGFRCIKEFLEDLEKSESVRNFGITHGPFKPRSDGVSNIVYCESPLKSNVDGVSGKANVNGNRMPIRCRQVSDRHVVKEQGRYILAIECDGAAYHSSLVARTRDRARQRFLRN